MDQLSYYVELLFGFLFLKQVVNNNTFNWYWYISTIELWFILIVERSIKYFYKTPSWINIFITCSPLEFFPIFWHVLNKIQVFKIYGMKYYFWKTSIGGFSRIISFRVDLFTFYAWVSELSHSVHCLFSLNLE